MNTKRIIQIVLLSFVAVSVVFLIVGESQKRAAAANAPQSSNTVSDAKTKVIAFYFHGNFRCVSCRKLESVSRQAVQNGFTDQLKRGDLQWRTVNVEESANEHFISDYHLFSRSLVLVRFKDGKQVEYKNLMKAWELLRDDEALKKYVQSEVRSYLQEG
jgi:hypothetical protein